MWHIETQAGNPGFDRPPEIAERYPGSSDFAHSSIARKTPGYSRHPWRSRCATPAAFAFAILQTQSRFRGNDEETVSPNLPRPRTRVLS
jgi:hypothetical protein